MKKYLYILFSGLLAGILIGIGVCVYLSAMSLNKIAASFLFGIGLFCIFQFQLYLYTGKIGFVLDNKPKYFLDLLFCLIGNAVGIMLFCLLLKVTRIGGNLEEAARALVDIKQNDSWYSIILLSACCGVMIYLAVKGNQIKDNNLARAISCFFAISIFILSGFEHCIANIGYYVLAGEFSWKGLGYILLMILGNSLGSIIIDIVFKLEKYFKEKWLQKNEE